MSLIQPIQYVFFGARGHGASAFAHPTLAGARRSDGAIFLPLAKGASQPALSIPKAGRAAAIAITRLSLPSPPSRGSGGCSAALAALEKCVCSD
jgi:hypothetical protein